MDSAMNGAVDGAFNILPADAGAISGLGVPGVDMVAETADGVVSSAGAVLSQVPLAGSQIMR